MYLQSYKIIGVGPCLADGTQFRVTALLSRDISELMPYLNAALKFCVYEFSSSTLTFKLKGNAVVLHPDRIIVGQLREVDDAEDILDAVIEFINHINVQKENIRPDYTIKELPQPKEVYNLLPKTNCSNCGEVTCIAFAVKLIKGEKKAEECPNLSSVQAERIYAILDTIDDSGTIFEYALVQVR